MSASATNARTHLFLSYAVEDRATAAGVVGALASLGWDVWWDRELLPGKTFDERISDRPASAGAVIGLWARHSVTSEWVREEASDAKRRDILIPAFIEQVEPPFGFKLRHAVDLTSWDGSATAPEFAALAAAIRSLVPPTTSSARSSTNAAPARDEQLATRRRAVRAWLIAAIVASAAAVGGLWYWDAYYRIQVEHFAHVIRRAGLPEGIDRLDASTVARRNVSLALVRRGRRNPVDEVRLVNSSGNTPPFATYSPLPSFSELNPLSSSVVGLNNALQSELMVVTMVTFTRDATGRILEQTGLSAGGRAVYTLHYGSPEIGEYKRHGFASPIRESGIAYLRFTRVREGPHAGLDEKVSYFDAAQRPQPDDSGEYGYRTVFDERGLVREQINLGASLEDRPNRYGLLKIVQVHDRAGNVIEASNLDAKGQPVLDRLGFAGARMQYNDAGNLSRATFRDRSGAPVTAPGLGVAGFVMTYDSQGRITSQTFFGPDQQPVIGRGGFAKQTLEWPTSSRSVIRVYGPFDRPLPVLGGAFEVVQTWDARGLIIETTYRNSKSDPTRTEAGCSTLLRAYDGVGNVSEVRCLNEERAPTIMTDGSSIARIVSDERGNPVTTTLFDPSDKPGVQGESYVAIRREYTPAGKLARVRFFDAAGKPTKVREGFASYMNTHDTSGNQVRRAYLDESDHPTVIVGGYAAATSEYDSRNREIRTSYRSTDGRLVRSDDGYATIQREWDGRGFVDVCAYFGEDGRPVKSVDGYARARFKRNERGQPLEIVYLDEQGRPVISARPGSGRRRFTYDPSGRLMERADLDIAGRPITNAYGYSVMRYSYDEHGIETGRQLLDVNGKALTFRVGVDKVVRGSSAAGSGFRVGDVVLTYDGEAVTTRYHFTNRLELFKGDRPREVTVERGGQIIGLDLTAGRVSGLTLEEQAHP